MKHRIAIILLGGWILMRPPVYVDGSNYSAGMDESVPVSAWEQVVATDTAIECEKIRIAAAQAQKEVDCDKEAADVGGIFNTEERQPRTPKERWYKITKWNCFWEKAAFMRARCVPAEHIYPPRTK